MTPSMAAHVVVNIRTSQDASINAVQSRGVTLSGIQRFSVLFNGYSAQIAVKDLGKLVEAVGKANIHFSRLTQLDETASNSSTGVNAVPDDLDPSVYGDGAYVGVVDTGVDYTHPDFGGDGTNHGFPTAKIVAGYDFAGDNAGAIDDPSLMSPDHDPMDTNEHGTHVSGIIAADGSIRGVARKAKIVIAKISPAGIGSAWSEQIIAAWEYMADPNNLDAGDEGSHPVVQSVNMSFGSVAGFDDHTDPERVAIENAIASGIVATLSAGNSASHYTSPFNYNFYPDYSTLGSPATTPGAISVASTENSIIAGWGITEMTAAADYVYFTGSTSPDPIVSLGDNGGAGYEYVYCGLGRDSGDPHLGVPEFPDDFAGLALTGKIALISRGTTSFFLKINNAADRGAVGVVIMNNTTGTISMATDGSTLTSVSITQADGLTLKAKAAAPVGDGTGRLEFIGHYASTPNPAANTISTFSSWGATPNLTFKPEVTAPGGNIWSTVPVAQGSYANLSGTSMAAPHVAAISAIIMLAHPAWTVEQVKTALMNTTTLLIDPASLAHLPYSPRLQGAGHVDVYNALHNDVTVASQGTGEAAVALGSLESWKSDPITFPLVLHNSGSDAVTYVVTGTVQWVNAGGTATSYAIPGATFAASPSAVTVPAGGTRTVTVTVNATAVNLSYDYFPYVEGFVTFTPASGVALNVPYMGYLGNWNDFDSSTWAPTFNPLVDLPMRVDSYSANFWASSTDLGKTGATWPEDPTNGWNQMGKTFTGSFKASTIAINPDRAADGPNGGVENNIYVLRNIENLKVEIRDSSNSLVKLIDDVNNGDCLWKGDYATYGNDYSWYWSGNAAWQWYGTNTAGAKVADGQYYLNTVATAEKVVGQLGYDAPQTVSFPVYVDTVNPTAVVTSVVAGAPGMLRVNFSGSDSGSGLWGYAVYYGVQGTDQNTWAHAMVAPAATSYEVPAGDWYFVVAYDNARNFSVALQIVTDTLPDGAVDQAYSTDITTTGGTGSYVYTISAGAIPNGLVLSASGTISGIPTIAGVYTFTVQVADGTNVATKAYTMNVYGSGLSITTPSPLPAGMLGVPYYQVLSAVGGDGSSYTWSLNGGALPPGLSINLLTPVPDSTTAALQGTPTVAGTYNFNLKVVSAGQAAFKDFSVTITPLMYHITPSAGVGGTISPSTVQDVLYGNNATFTIAADPWYQIADVLVDSTSVGPLLTYTFSNVTANHTIAASFALGLAPATVSFGPSLTPGQVLNAGGTLAVPLLLSGDLDHAAYLDLYVEWYTLTSQGFSKIATVQVSPLSASQTYTWNIPADFTADTAYLTASVWRNDGTNGGAGSYSTVRSGVMIITPPGSVAAVVASPVAGATVTGPTVPVTLHLGNLTNPWGNIMEIWFSPTGAPGSFVKVYHSGTGFASTMTPTVDLSSLGSGTWTACHFAVTVYVGGTTWRTNYSPTFTVTNP